MHEVHYPDISVQMDKKLVGLLLQQYLNSGEYCMSGDIKPVDCDIEDIITFLLSNISNRKMLWYLSLNYQFAR